MTETEMLKINTDKNSKCQILKCYGTVGERNTKDGTQSLDLCLVKWFNGPARLDLRWWGNGIAGKGCTFNAASADSLRKMLNSIDLNLGAE